MSHERDFVAEVYAQDWVDITSDVRVSQGFTIDWGQRGEDPRPSHSTCSFLLNNRHGKYSPRNPTSPYFELIGRNTPFRLRLGPEATDVFDRTVTDGWGTSTSGHAWSITGIGVTAADFDVAGGVGTQSLPANGNYAMSLLMGTSLLDVGMVATFSVPFADVQGASVDFGILLRGQSTTEHYIVHIQAQPDETVLASITEWFNTISSNTVVVSGLTFGGTLRIRAEIEGATIRTRIWDPAGPEPAEWHHVYADSRPEAITSAGWVGLRSGLGVFGGTNTNTKPVVVSVSDVEVYEPWYAGEITAWPPRWHPSGNDSWVDMQAAGVLRRLSQGSPPEYSALRRYIEQFEPVAHWPLDDGQGATRGANTRDINRPLVPDRVLPEWGAQSPASWLGTGVKHTRSVTSSVATASKLTAQVNMPPSTTEWGVDVVFVATVGNDTLPDYWQLLIDFAGTAAVWQVSVGSDDLAVDTNWAGGGGTAIDGYFDGAPHHFRFRASQAGANITWFVYLDGALALNGTELARTLAPVEKTVEFTNYTVLNGGTLVLHEAVVWTTPPPITDTAAAAFGHPGEPAAERIARLCSEAGIDFAVEGDPAESEPMGTQGVSTLLDAIHEAVEADRGLLSELRGTVGLTYRTRRGLYNQAATATATWGQLVAPPEPTDDDLYTRNDVTITRRDGASYRSIEETGRMSVLDPQDGGAGRYRHEETLVLASDTQVPHAAGWIRHLGTVDEPRYPGISFNLASPKVDATLARSLKVLTGGDRLVVTGAPQQLPSGPIDQVVLGATERLSKYDHTLTYVGAPRSPYTVFQVEDTTYGRLHTAGSELAVAVDEDDTTFSVATTARQPWTTNAARLPLDLSIGGEDVTVTDIDDVPLAFVSAGTVAHGNNANVTPGLPAGWAAGHLLVMPAVIRNADAGTPNTPAGWTLLAELDIGPTVAWSNLRLFGKIAQLGETAPTVTFFNGTANADTSAQIAAFSGAFYDLDNLIVRYAACLNPSGQNITYPGIPIRLPNCLVLYLGWKQDDATSVTSPGTEIGEHSTTLGDDQLLVWSYQIQTTAANIPSGSFTVTGGVSAISRGAVVAIRSDRQTFTVTRSANGVQKAHSVGTPVRLASRHVIAR